MMMMMDDDDDGGTCVCVLRARLVRVCACLCVSVRGLCARVLRVCVLRACSCVLVDRAVSVRACACLCGCFRVVGGSMTTIISVLFYHLAHDLLDEPARHRVELVDGMTVVVSPRTGASLGVFQVP